MRSFAWSIALVGVGALGCAGHPGSAQSKFAVLDRQFFDLCPLGVPQPSLTLVTDRLKWRQILASARTAPPPFDASATTFDTISVIILATRATATPRTRLWVRDDAITLDKAARRLRLDIQVSEVRPDPGAVELTVVGMPCLVIWTSRVDEVDTIEARDAVTGRLLIEVNGP
jgi:hypothetical protein